RVVITVGSYRGGRAEVASAQWPKPEQSPPQNSVYFIAVQSISLSAPTETYVGEELTITATVRPPNAGDQRLAWTLGGAQGAASLSETGRGGNHAPVLTARQAGSVTLQAQAMDESGVRSNQVTVNIRSTVREALEKQAAEYDQFLQNHREKLTPEGLAAFEKALAEAKALLAKDTASDADYQAALEALRAAFQQLHIQLVANPEKDSYQTGEQVVITPLLDGTGRKADAWAHSGAEATLAVNSPATLTFKQAGQVTVTFTDTSGLTGSLTFTVHEAPGTGTGAGHGSAQTGDNGQIGFWALLLGISAVSSGSAVWVRRRLRNKTGG
ncbi:hypothetical protein LJC49_11335, partial [Ruminococcaceae bacterium OttesenSCG-928-I18]|nr:hypothetical protein [Ruminococcaceae bacterium OttesenSCG-928-I18]